MTRKCPKSQIKTKTRVSSPDSLKSSLADVAK